MSPSSSKYNVLIIGGGLGGLSLAQALRRQNIRCAVFERDVSATSRLQGWAITLSALMIDELKAAVPDELGDLEPVGHLYEHSIPCEGAVFDVSAGGLKELRRFGPVHGQAMIRANRQKLRQWFLTGLDVHWNKRFTRFEQDTEGVTAIFEDGSSYRGDILVGADGIQSRVRNQLIPDGLPSPRAVPLGCILGEVTATEEQYLRWMKTAASYFTGVAGDLRMTVALRDISPDKRTAHYYWLFGWSEEKAVAEDYWTTSASKEQLHSYVAQNLDRIHPIFAEVMRATPVEGMLHPPLRLRDMTPPDLSPGRVILIGDAFHPMLPFRGQGGNMAIKDGLSLADAIGDTTSKTIDDIFHKFDEEARPRATNAVLSSRAAATTAEAA